MIKNSFEEALKIVRLYSTLNFINLLIKIDDFQKPDSFSILDPTKVISDIAKILKIRNASDIGKFREDFESVRFEVTQIYNSKKGE